MVACVKQTTTDSSCSDGDSGVCVDVSIPSMEDGEDKRGGGKECEFSHSFLYLMTFAVTLSSLCFGYNLAIISGAMLYVTPAYNLDTTWQSVLVGAAVISATVLSLGAGRLGDKLGRRRTLLLNAVLSVAGPVIAAAAPGKEVLLAGRLVTGVTFALTITFTALYIAEMSPASIRGRLGTMQQFQFNIGMLLSAIGAGGFSYLPSQHWRYMLGFGALPAILFGVAMFLLPETPHWLIAKGRNQEATRVLQRIYVCDDVSVKVKGIRESIASDPPRGVCSTLSRVVKTPHVLRALAVGSCLSFFTMWCGVNAIFFFNGSIIKTVGFPLQHAVWIQGLAPLAMFFSLFPGIYAVERYGRRPIILISIAGCALSMAVISVGFHLTAADVPDVFNVTNGSLSANTSTCYTFTRCEACVQDADCGLCHNDGFGFCLPALNEHHSALGPCAENAGQRDDAFSFAQDYCPSLYAWIVVAGIFLFCAFFSPGLGALNFVVNSEIYPMWARSIGVSLVTALFWTSNVVISFSFLTMVETFGMPGTFWFFSAMCVLGLVLLAVFLPETKNRSLEEMEQLFMTSRQLHSHLQQREINPIEEVGKI